MRQRQSDRAGASLAGVRISNVHQRLRHPIALQNNRAIELPEFFVHLRRQRSRAGNREPQPCTDLPRHDRRQLEQTDEHRRHAEENRGPVIFEPLGRLRVLEAFEQAQVAAAEEPAVQPIREAVHVKERQRREVAIRCRDIPRRHQRQRIGRKVALRQHRPFRRARRARCVDQRHRGIRIRGHRDPRGGLSRRLRDQRVHVPHDNIGRDQRRQIARCDDRRRLGVAQDVRELALSVEHIDRHDDQAELGPREPEIDHLDPILQKECDAITGLGSARSEQVREPIAAVLQIPKSKRTPPSVPAFKL